MKKILFSLMALVVVIGLAGGAFAYFTDVAPSTSNTMAAGTLNLLISNDGGINYYDSVGAVITSPSGWAPGTQFTTPPIYLKNVGNIDAQNVFGTVCKPIDNVPNFSNQIKVVSISDYVAGSGWETSTFDAATSDVWLTFWGAPAKGYITLADLWYYGNPGGSSAKTGFYMYNMFTADTTPWLPAGQIGAVQFTFELLKSTTNAFQGASTSFELDFIASQYRDADLDTYIDGALGQYWR
jgi:predicted ribosomally synthesized peptide with SipW-like signal peptide